MVVIKRVDCNNTSQGKYSNHFFLSNLKIKSYHDVSTKSDTKYFDNHQRYAISPFLRKVHLSFYILVNSHAT